MTSTSASAAPVRQIAIRFTQQEFEALDDQRHRLHTTWQSVGTRLFAEWQRGESVCPMCGFQPDNVSALSPEKQVIMRAIIAKLVRADRTLDELRVLDSVLLGDIPVNSAIAQNKQNESPPSIVNGASSSVDAADVLTALRRMEATLDHVASALGATSERTSSPQQQQETSEPQFGNDIARIIGETDKLITQTEAARRDAEFAAERTRRPMGSATDSVRTAGTAAPATTATSSAVAIADDDACAAESDFAEAGNDNRNEKRRPRTTNS